MTKMEEERIGRRPKKKTTKMKDVKNERLQNGRQPKWKMTKIDRRPKWKMTKIGRRPKWKMTKKEDK